MKTERRHELQHNTLADIMSDVGENAKPYAKAILGVLLAGIVVFGTYLYLSKRSEAEEAASWDLTWQALSNPETGKQMEQLREAADKFPDKQAGLWAQLTLADLELNRGVAALFIERSVAQNELRTAVEDYQAVEKHGTHPLMRQHALFGIGRADESLIQLDDARAAYDKLIKDYPNGPYFNRAKQRVENLASDSTKRWYDWFRDAEPTASGKGSPVGKGSDDFPFAEPDNFKPPMAGTTSPDKSTPKPSETKSNDKATKPVEAKPAETKSDSKATDGKATEAKPAPSEPAGADAKSADAKSANAKSDGTKPAESKPADAKSPEPQKDAAAK